MGISSVEVVWLLRAVGLEAIMAYPGEARGVELIVLVMEVAMV